MTKMTTRARKLIAVVLTLTTAAILLAFCAAQGALGQWDKPTDGERGLPPRAGSTDVILEVDGDDEEDGEVYNNLKGNVDNDDYSDYEADAENASVAQASRDNWRVFMVGTDDYLNVGSLTCCVNDVVKLSEKLVESGVPKTNITILKSISSARTLPTKVNIEREYSNFIESLQENDIAMIYLSGHGIELVAPGRKPIPYYAPQDADRNAIEDTCVSIKQMMADLEASPAKVKWMIVDACRESVGKGVSEGRSLMTTVADAPESIILLQSCASGEISFEDPKVGNGIFTLSLIEALSGNDNPADGTVGDLNLTFTEMYDYVCRRTQERAAALSRPKQTPYVTGSLTNFALMTNLMRKGHTQAEWSAADEYCTIAEDLLSRGNRDAALVSINKALRIIPNESRYVALHRLAASGVADKQADELYQEGLTYWYGTNGIKIDEERAYERFSEAAAKGSQEATGLLSYINYFGAPGQAPDRKKSYDLANNAATQRSSAMALWVMGDCYRQGISATPNITKSDEYFKKAFETLAEASDAGDLIATTQLGMLYYEGAGVEQSFKKAVECWQKAADGGIPRAMNSLGECLRKGQGVERDDKKAREWFEKACDYDYPNALVSLGECYLEGIGVSQNFEQARRLFQRAADANSPEGMSALARYYFTKYDSSGNSEDLSEGETWLNKSAELGSPSGINNLGIYYRQKGKGDQAKWQFEKAAELGYVPSIVNLGNLYFAENNMTEAKQQYQRAATLGSATAMAYLGMCYAHEGKDQEALTWYQKSANLEDPEGLFRLGEAYYYGNGIEQSYKKAGNLFLKSDKLDNPYASYMLGEMFANGYGTAKNEARAFNKYLKAAEYCRTHYYEPNARALREAFLKVSERYQKGEGCPKDTEKAKEYRAYYNQMR